MQQRVIKELRTIRPSDGEVLLPVTPSEAERLWFTVVCRNDRKNFELLVEPYGKSQCIVTVRPWSKSGPLCYVPNYVIAIMFIATGVLCLIS